ncbi:MAG: hypothetical protein P8077_04920, partial [Gammaproteobacteria bacterium]
MQSYKGSESKIGYFVVDDLLPQDLALEIFSCFPETKEMRLKRSIREYKYIAAQMNKYNPILEESVYAFQDSRVVSLIARICSWALCLVCGALSPPMNLDGVNDNCFKCHQMQRGPFVFEH